MQAGFICPDGKRVTHQECLEGCRARCLTLPTLVSLANTRDWNGIPSTTQCLNGTRMEYLKIINDYYVKPKDRAFALLGTRHHFRLEAITKKLNVLSEEKLQGEVSGIADLLEPDIDPDTYILADYKTSGSYKVARALKGDMADWELQLNNYRVMAEALGFPVSRMLIQCTVRDGGTFMAKKNGCNENIYLIPVTRMNNSEVKDYFYRKSQSLIKAVESGEMPPPCDGEERWGGKRCLGYCDVADFCPDFAIAARPETRKRARR